MAGAVPAADEAAGEHQPSRCGWDGGDQDESLHAAVKGDVRQKRSLSATLSRSVPPQKPCFYFSLPALHPVGVRITAAVLLTWTLHPACVSSGLPAAPLSSALPANLRCPLAHHPGLHGQVHARRLQRLAGEWDMEWWDWDWDWDLKGCCFLPLNAVWSFLQKLHDKNWPVMTFSRWSVTQKIVQIIAKIYIIILVIIISIK